MRLPELRRLVTRALIHSAACGQLGADPATHRNPYALVGSCAIPLPPATGRLFDREVNLGHLVVTDIRADRCTATGDDVLLVTTANGGTR